MGVTRVVILNKMAPPILHLSLIILSSVLFPVTQAYFVNVDAHAMECFFDKVSNGMKMSLTFEVVEGGFLDIDVEASHMIIT